MDPKAHDSAIESAASFSQTTDVEKGDGHQTRASSFDDSVKRVPEINVEEKAEGNPHELMWGRLEPLPTWRRVLIMFGLCFGLLLSLMDTSIISTSIYTIALDFNSLAKAIWVVLAYTLTYLGLTTTFASLSDFVGRRQAVLYAFITFIAFSIGGGFSQRIDQLIAMRALQGMGGAGLYSMAIILLIEVSTDKMLAITPALIGVTISISGVLGPVIGGVLTEYASWRWIFWINGPCGAVAMLCFAIGWPRHTKAYDAHKKSFSQFDYIGTILLLSSTFLVVFALQQAGTGSYSWNSGLAIGTLVAGALSWVLSFAWSYTLHRRFLNIKIVEAFPFKLMTHRVWVSGLIVTTLTGFIFFVCIISMPLRFQIVNQKSPTAAGIELLPLLCSAGFGSFIGGAVSSKKNNTSYTLIAATCFILLGSGLLSTLDDSIHLPGKVYGFQFITGFGVGLTFAAISVMTSLETTFDTHAVAQGFVSMSRIFGGSIGVAASNALFNTYAHRQLGGILSTTEIAQLQTSTTVLATLTPAQAEAVRSAYSDSFSQCLRICVYITAASFVISLGTWQRHPPSPIRGPPSK